MKDRRTWHLMFLLALLAALTSTPLRLVEAASDQARTLAEIGDDASVEPEDGGVGDDSDASIRSDDPTGPLVLTLAIDERAVVPLGPLESPLRSGGSPLTPPPRPPENSSKRRATLQRYLI